ncbi:MAG TPA: TonB-dependent receptor [Terriglobia bacterium]|nr:TonB-dependent receptor [Terriglobia bacterium]
MAFTLIFAAPSLAVTPQRTQELRGEVVNEQGYPIGGVNCTLSGGMLPSAGLTVATGQKGEFGIRGLLPGTYGLACTALGYQAFVQAGLKIAVGEARLLHIVMPTQKVVVQKVEVRAEGGSVAQQEAAPPSKLSSQELATLPIAEQKFKSALPLVPGVIRTPNGKINIKGSTENQGMLLIDSAQAISPVTGSFDIDLSIDAIQSLNVYKAPLDAQYGGFSGGLTTIDTKAPGSQWGWDLNDFFPGFRGRSGHLVGINDWSPRLDFTGPIWKNNLTFSEEFVYDMQKIPVRGLAWPHNETKHEGYNSFTTFQYVFSPQHVASLNLHVFPRKVEFADINSLIPQSASSNFSQRGYSLQGNDSYQFNSGAILSSLFEFTEFDNNAHGQGPLDMLVTPSGLGGNYFNTWDRGSNQSEASTIYRFPSWKRFGTHQMKIGGDFIYRTYSGTSASQPIQVLRADGTVAERIDFLAPDGMPSLSNPSLLGADNVEGTAFIQDHWMWNDHTALNMGLRYFGQAVGKAASFDPRLGFVYSPGHSGRTILRAGVGIFQSRVPLLASDFASNPMRAVTLFDAQGNALGAPITYRNVCATRTSLGLRMVPACSDLDATPYNLTWNLELDRQITPRVALRFSYLSSSTFKEFVISPVEPSPVDAMLMLSNRGAVRYHEFESTVSYRAENGTELNVSYVHSRAFGDLNTVESIFVPFEEPVIRPNAYSSLPSDVPDRLIAWGVFKLPEQIVFSPIIDLHTGFPYSNLDVLQNYVGLPNSSRFPAFFSFDFKVWKMLPLPGFLPFGLGKMKLRWGIGVRNLTNTSNPRDVYDNIASPYFNHFVGYQHRVIEVNVDTGS